MAKHWVQFVIGFWIMISPWLLGFSEVTLAKWSNVLLGLVIVLMSVWTMAGKSKKV
jgi:hypothetical protein